MQGKSNRQRLCSDCDSTNGIIESPDVVLARDVNESGGNKTGMKRIRRQKGSISYPLFDDLVFNERSGKKKYCRWRELSGIYSARHSDATKKT